MQENKFQGCGNRGYNAEKPFQNKEIIVINSISKKENPILNCGKHFSKDLERNGKNFNFLELDF